MHGENNRSARAREAICALCLAFLAFRANAQDPKQWRLLIEPSYMHPPVAWAISGAKRTVLVAGYIKDGEPVYFTRKEFDALALDWNHFQEQVRANEVAAVKPDYARNRKNIIEYATIKAPLAAAVVLSPKFLDMFSEVFGTSVLVAMPDRRTAYVFPKLAGDYQDYAPMILDAYRAALHPVSAEVFEVSPKGIKAVGIYEEP